MERTDAFHSEGKSVVLCYRNPKVPRTLMHTSVYDSLSI